MAHETEQKALELIDKMYLHTQSIHSKNDGKETAKLCAIIFCDEMLLEKEDALDVFVNQQEIELTHKSIEFWTNVKTELLK